jgi:hypothetical protein
MVVYVNSKLEIRNSKFEIRNKFKTLNSNVQNVLNLGDSIFGFVSANFIKSGEIRISNFDFHRFHK